MTPPNTVQRRSEQLASHGEGGHRAAAQDMVLPVMPVSAQMLAKAAWRRDEEQGEGTRGRPPTGDGAGRAPKAQLARSCTSRYEVFMRDGFIVVPFLALPFLACGSDDDDTGAAQDGSGGLAADSGAAGQAGLDASSGGVAGGGGAGAAGSGGAAGKGGGGADAGLDAAGGQAGQATDASTWQPDPIPVVDEDPPPPCAAAQNDPYHFQFLDNLCDDKATPTDTDRERACPAADSSATVTLTGGQSVEYRPSTASVAVDSSALVGIVPAGMQVTVIMIKRVQGTPHYRYLSNGTHDQAYQPWSTTKFLAAANAAASLRIASGYTVGLTASVDGVPLGDLVTSIHNYDHDPYSSNALGRYFHNVGGRDRANDLIHALWLNRPATETFGGNYGEVEPPLGYAFVESGGKSVTITPDTSAGPANHLSSFTAAEALKRLVLHREEPSQRLPGIQWADLRVLLYGAENSTKYGPWGGMTADTAAYLHVSHDMDYIEERSHGTWRTFSKLGLGSGGQFVHVGYACFSVLDPNEQPVTDWGREFVIAAHLPTGGATWRERDRLMAATYRAIVTRIVDGRL